MGKTKKHKPDKRNPLDRKTFSKKGRRFAKKQLDDGGGESFERFYGRKKKK